MNDVGDMVGDEFEVNCMGSTINGGVTPFPARTISVPFLQDTGMVILVTRIAGYKRGRTSPYWYLGTLHETCEGAGQAAATDRT
jgi:hypothetical protein